MRSVWIALAVIVAGSLLGAFLLWRKLDTNSPAKPLVGPRGAQLIEEHPLGASRLVTWRIGGHPEEPSSGLYGVTIWEGKRRLYEHRAEPTTSGIRVETGDFSGDGRLDVLLFTDKGDGCGTYRAIVTGPGRATPVATRSLCSDKSSIHLTRSGLVVREGSKRTVFRWNGRRLVVVR